MDADTKSQLATIAGRLTASRMRAGLTQREMARRLGLSASAVGQWEAGYAEPSSINLRKAARILEVASEWLETGRGPSAITPGIHEPMAGLKAEGELVDVGSANHELSRQIAAAVGDRKAEVWRLNTDKVQAAGYQPGDYLVVDKGIVPPPRSIVLAEISTVPIFRLYLPPCLFAVGLGAPEPYLVEDKIRVIIRGTVVSKFSLS